MEERERESATICKKAQLIRYDQQAKQQSTTMLATNPQRALQVPKGPPKLHLATYNLILGTQIVNNEGL